MMTRTIDAPADARQAATADADRDMVGRQADLDDIKPEIEHIEATPQQLEKV